MSKLVRFNAILALTMAASPAILRAQVDPDLPLTSTASCFSICVESTNVKGVAGDVTVTNLTVRSVNIGATVQVQCNGADVAGASQTLGPQPVPANTSTTLSYSIPFTAVAGCAYTVVTTATSSAFSGRSSTVTTPFTADCVDQPCGATGCTLTQGFWKNHLDWPVSTLTLGTTSYTQAQLLSILKQPVKGNGLVSLAHQLIAAKLNIANGASGSAISATIASADAMIDGLVVPPVGSGSLSTSSVGNLVTLLDQFNSGLLPGGPGHCSE